MAKVSNLDLLKTISMKNFSTSLLFFLLVIFSSCDGQNNSKIDSGQERSLELGKKVSSIEGGALVIFQDSRDNYWFGGNDNGVYKYDRCNLVLFTKNDGLCSNAVVGIQEDQLGNIFFDTQEGICKFDGTEFSNIEIFESLTSKFDWKLEPNDLWFRMGWDENGPYRFDGEVLYHLEFPKTAQEDIFNSKYPNVSFNPYGVYTMYKDRRGDLWFGTSSLGVCRFDGETINWLYEDHLTETPEGGAFGFRSIFQDQEGFFWFSNTRYRFEILPGNTESKNKGLLKYKREKGVGYASGSGEMDIPYFMSVVDDENGDLWMVTYDDGVYRKKGAELIHYPVKDDGKTVLLFSIYKDNHENLWLGTHHNGVYRLDGETFVKFNP